MNTKNSMVGKNATKSRKVNRWKKLEPNKALIVIFRM